METLERPLNKFSKLMKLKKTLNLMSYLKLLKRCFKPLEITAITKKYIFYLSF